MSRFHICVLIILALTSVGSLAVAKDQTSANRVELLTDQKAGTLRVLIDGEAGHDR